MKKEAGVTAHTVHNEDFVELACIGTGRIYSPEGRKIVQLYTLAHECKHIFLHNSGPGYTFPGHVKEFEAESYAHQLSPTKQRTSADHSKTVLGIQI